MRPQPEEYAVIRLVNANLREEEEEKQEELDLGKNECAASAYAQSQELERGVLNRPSSFCGCLLAFKIQRRGFVPLSIKGL